MHPARPSRPSSSSASSRPSTNRSHGASTAGAAVAAAPDSSESSVGPGRRPAPAGRRERALSGRVPGPATVATTPNASASARAGPVSSAGPEIVSVNTVATSGSDVSFNATSCTETAMPEADAST